jgi:hypothetical protein
MIQTPFRFEKQFTSSDFEILGRLSLRWSHIDHTAGNCLRVLLRLNPDEAVTMVFSLSSESRLRRIKELIEIKPVSAEAVHFFRELDAVMKGIRSVRNNVIHAVLFWAGSTQQFHLRSKLRTYSKDQIFQAEELTNYAAHAVLNLRHALGKRDFDPDEIPPPLPERPEIPEFLRSLIRWPRDP